MPLLVTGLVDPRRDEAVPRAGYGAPLNAWLGRAATPRWGAKIQVGRLAPAGRRHRTQHPALGARASAR